MILDTNAVSAWSDGEEELLDAMAGAGLVMLPVIAIGEYRYGLKLSTQRTEREAWLRRVIDTVHVLPVTRATAGAYADIRSQLHRKGRSIPTNDAWIAALALEHRLPVLSRDAHFDVVDGVERVSW
ncbi:MAG TPA: type II toxin-antitoxin system VapC family toxin [Dehalococcoidia bacterium]|nr:type II toxin-antitoxin system VapC family toxin [Dehalococcoidia bacterium]